VGEMDSLGSMGDVIFHSPVRVGVEILARWGPWMGGGVV
jgi:hypothetical protein